MKIKFNSFWIVFLAGLSTILASAPLFFIPIMFAVIPYIYLQIQGCKNIKSTFKVSTIFGFGYYIGNTYWISLSMLTNTKFIPLLPVSLIANNLYFAIFFVLCMIIFKAIEPQIQNKIMKVFTFALLWVLHEKLRAHGIFPFPWWQIGMTLSNIDSWIQPLHIISIYFFSFFVVCLYLLPAIAIQNCNKMHKIQSISFVLLIHLIFLGYGRARLQSAHENTPSLPFHIGLVQTNFTQYEKWHEVESALYKYHELTKNLTKTMPKSKPKLIIWPETSIPYSIPKYGKFKPELESYLSAIQREIGNKDHVIFGGISTSNGQHFNSAFLLGKHDISKIYDKINLVPFGEYIPFGIKIFDWPGFSPGNKREKWDISGQTIIPLICYEILFDSKIKKMHPDIIVNISNDGWFGTSIGPHQHLYHARVAAIRNEATIIRVANTGKSAVIDKYGRILKSIERKEENCTWI